MNPSARFRSLGTLEQQVMDILWRRHPRSGREVQRDLGSQPLLARQS